MKEIWIPGNTASLKNSKIATSNGVFMSKTVTKYLRNLNIQYYSPSKKYVKEYVDINRPNLFKQAFKNANWVKPDKQIVLGMHFVRGTRHKWDFVNIAQCPLDLMTAHDFIEDDNMYFVVPMPYKKNKKWFSYSKESTGVYIKILKL